MRWSMQIKIKFVVSETRPWHTHRSSIRPSLAYSTSSIDVQVRFFHRCAKGRVLTHNLHLSRQTCLHWTFYSSAGRLSKRGHTDKSASFNPSPSHSSRFTAKHHSRLDRNDPTSWFIATTNSRYWLPPRPSRRLLWPAFSYWRIPFLRPRRSLPVFNLNYLIIISSSIKMSVVFGVCVVSLCTHQWTCTMA